MPEKNSEILRRMVRSAPDQVSNLDKSIAQLDSQISDLNQKLTAVKDGMMTPESDKLVLYLSQTKYPVPTYFLRYGANFNQAMSTTGNITDWKVYKAILDNDDPSMPHYHLISNTRFSCHDDMTTIFATGVQVAFAIHDGTSCTSIEFSTVASSIFDSTNEITEVEFTTPIISITDHGVIATYFCDYISGDPTIDGHVSNWNFGHDYIHHPIGLTGTYGLQDNIDKLTASRGMSVANKNKANTSITVLGPYAG